MHMNQRTKKQKDHTRSLSILNSVVADNLGCFYDEYWQEFQNQTEIKKFHSFVVAKEWEKIKPLKLLKLWQK